MLATALLLLRPVLAWAEIYFYEDSQGKKHYVSEHSQIPEEYRDGALDSKSMRAVSKISSRDIKVIPSSKQSPRHAKVEIFVTHWCPYCRKLEEFLKKEKISYSRYDVESQAYGKKFYQSVGMGGIPVVKIGKTIIRGFEPQQILNAVGR